MSEERAESAESIKQQQRDVVEVTPSEYNSVRLDSQLLNVELLNEPGLDFGITVHHDGTDVALASGTIRPTARNDGRPHIHTYHGLTNEQAREIADALYAAADEAARIEEEIEEEQDSDQEGFLRRLMP